MAAIDQILTWRRFLTRQQHDNKENRRRRTRRNEKRREEKRGEATGREEKRGEETRRKEKRREVNRRELKRIEENRRDQGRERERKRWRKEERGRRYLSEKSGPRLVVKLSGLHLSSGERRRERIDDGHRSDHSMKKIPDRQQQHNREKIRED